MDAGYGKKFSCRCCAVCVEAIVVLVPWELLCTVDGDVAHCLMHPVS